MRCYICDKILNDPQPNHDHGDYDPCPTCLEVIQDTIGKWVDRPSMDEDEFPDESYLADLYIPLHHPSAGIEP